MHVVNVMFELIKYPKYKIALNFLTISIRLKP